MKNAKYRSLMVTPAFIEARERKFEHDFSQGRVIPLTPGKKASVLRPLALSKESARPKTTAAENDTKLASRLKTTSSAPGRVRTSRGSGNEEKKTLIGKHFLSWNIPGRIIADAQHTTGKLPLEASHSNPAAMSNCKKEQQLSSKARAKHGESQRVVAENKVSTLPKINPERKTNRRSSKESTKEAAENKDTDFTSQWLNKLDKEERSMAEELLKVPSVNIDHSASVKPVLMLSSNARKASNASGVSSQSASSALSRESSRTNILYRTSSVAWRRDSTWLKPRKSSYQTWHGLPCFPVESETSNVAAGYMRPHRKIDPTFIIHPDWGCKA